MNTQHNTGEAPSSSYSRLSQIRRRRKVTNITLIVLVFFLAALIAFPLYWMIRCSLVSKAALSSPEYFADPPSLFPKAIQWFNYTLAMGRIDFPQQLFNSVIITVPYVLGNLLTTSVSAYAFARIRFPLRGMWFGLVISTMMLPCAVTLLPQYAMYTDRKSVV